MEAPGPQSSIGERLRFVRENVLRMGLRELDREMSGMEGAVKHPALLNYEADRRQPDAAFLAALLRLAAQHRRPVSGHWLVSGEGDPFVIGASEAEAQIRQIRAILAGEATARDAEDTLTALAEVERREGGGSQPQRKDLPPDRRRDA